MEKAGGMSGGSEQKPCRPGAGTDPIQLDIAGMTLVDCEVVGDMSLAEQVKTSELAGTPLGRALTGRKRDVAELKSQGIREDHGLTG